MGSVTFVDRGWVAWAGLTALVAAVVVAAQPGLDPNVLPAVVVVGVLAGAVCAAAGLAVVARRLADGPAPARRWWGRTTVVVAVVAAAALLGVAAVPADGDFRLMNLALLGAALLGFAVVLAGGWTALLTSGYQRERAARVRAEERAEMAAHLHDSVLQGLLLIDRHADRPIEVRRLTRHTERELRALLYGEPAADPDDLACALRRVAEKTEDRFDVTVELSVVGTRPLDGPARAVLGAVREALTNAGRHSGATRVTAYVEVTGEEVVALVRDRGRGFTVPAGGTGRGIPDSIHARVRRHGGTAEVRSTPGDGTAVELRIPVAAQRD
jgi:signal transduction histidine kinase